MKNLLRASLPCFALLLSTACTQRADTAAPAEQPAAAPTTAAVASTPTTASSFEMAASGVKIQPEGCRAHQDGAWSMDMPRPTAEGWTATEHFGEHASTYACEGSTDAFECTTEAGFNYGPTGVDADVSLDVRYDGAWATTDDAFSGSFELAFTCVGTECSSVAQQWGVASFPCQNSGAFEGTAAEAAL